MKQTPYIIVAFGDSMTMCAAQSPALRWPALLQMRLNRTFKGMRFKVINAGVGGNTSREGLARMESDVLLHRPNLTLVEFGGNDATIDPARSVSFIEYVRNLAAIAERLRAIGSSIAWVSFPPVIDVWHQSNNPLLTIASEKIRPMGGLNQYLNVYRRHTRMFALKNRHLFIDLYAGIREVLEQEHPARFIMSDGVHFTDLGTRVAADIIFNALTRKSGNRLLFRFSR